MFDRLLTVLLYVLYGFIAVAVLERALADEATTRHLLSEKRQLQAQIQELRKSNLDRERVLHALARDPFYIEGVLRLRYGYRHVNEEIQRYSQADGRTDRSGRRAFVIAAETPPPPESRN
jgi:hypothetical protein